MIDSQRIQQHQPVPFNVNQDRSWCIKEKTIVDTTFNPPEGPIADHYADCLNEGDFFLKFIDSNIRENIKTNLYITQRHRRISPVTEQELFSFLGINILMGYHSLPSISLY